MTEHVECKGRQGPVTVLTLLFGLLLGFAGGTNVPLQSDPAATQLSAGDSLRRAAGLRLARSSDERPDSDESTASLPPTPRIVTRLASARPGANHPHSQSFVTPADRPAPYRARAPPAA